MSATAVLSSDVLHPPATSLRAVLLDLAARSALLRIAQRHGSNGDRWCIGGALRTDMDALGARLRNTGEDARTNPIFNLLECRWAYDDAFERQRRVVAHELTPRVIFTALQRENLLVWREWEVEVDGQHEVDDAYGQPGSESRIWVRQEGRADSRTMFSGARGDTARDIYRHITGQSFAGDDGLGDEPCHPAENGAWPDAQDDEGGEESADAARDEGACGYTCSADPEHADAMLKFHWHARVAHPQWLAMFDSEGRYYEPHSGFWASLAGEARDPQTGEWALAAL